MRQFMFVLLLTTAAFAQEPFSDVAPRATTSMAGSDLIAGGSSGTASFRQVFQLPAARGRYQPGLALTYNSEAGSGLYGTGWSLSENYIELSSRASPDVNGNARDQNWLVLNGSRRLLVASPPGQTTTYRPDVDTGYTLMTRSPRTCRRRPLPENDLVCTIPSWTAIDGIGNAYTFLPLADTYDAYARFYLTQVSDVDGNVVSFTYAAEPDTLSGNSRLLSTISYNNFGTGGYASLVELSYISSPAVQVAAKSGSVVSHTALLAAVNIKRQNANVSTPSYSLLYSYALTYSQSPATGRQMLQAITQFGRDGVTTAGPPVTFSYTATPNAFSLGPGQPLPALTAAPGFSGLLTPTKTECGHWFNSGGARCSVATGYSGQCAVSDLVAWMDIDGDGRADLVWGGSAPAGIASGIRWARNISRPQTGISFAPVEILPGSETWSGWISFNRPGGGQVLDIDGDGRPDLVKYDSSGTGCPMEVRFNRPDSTRNGAPSFEAPVCMSGGPASFLALDLTGDGVVDAASVTGAGITVNPGYKTAAGTWAFSTNSVLFAPGVTSLRTSGGGTTTRDLIDMNGDGLADLVWNDTSGWQVLYNSSRAFLPRPDTASTLWANANANLSAISAWDDTSAFDGVTFDASRHSLPDYIFKSPAQFTISINQSAGFSAASVSVAMPTLGGVAQDYKPLAFLKITSGGHPLEDYVCDMSGYNGMFVDVDGDGARDYVMADPTDGAQKWYWFRNSTGGSPPADYLSTVVSPSGATTTISYLPWSGYDLPSRGGRPRYLVSQTALSGLGIRPLTTAYWYANPQVSSAWDDPTRPDDFGFLDTYSQDNVTLLVHHTRWGATHVAAGSPMTQEIGVPTGAFSPGFAIPGATYFDRTTHAPLAWSIPSAGSCTDSPAATAYPVLVFDSAMEHLHTEGSLADSTSPTLKSKRTVDCTALDSAGNVHASFIDVDEASSGDEYTETTTFPDVSSGTVTCKRCALETVANTGAGTPDLYHRFYHYDAPVGAYDPATGPVRNYVRSGHLNYIEELVSAGGAYEVAVKRSYNNDGTVASIRKDYIGQDISSVTTSYQYDGFNLGVVRETTFDSTTSGATSTVLIIDRTLDPATGLLSAETGPYLSGYQSSAPIVSYRYDNVSRPVAIGRQDSAGASAVQLAAYEYVAPSSSTPAVVKAYSFAQAIPFPQSTIPAGDDVNQLITYYDALGRAVQTRTRLGTGTASTGSAQITQHLSVQYAVNAAAFDGAGRLLERLDPFYSTSGAFQDYSQSGGELTTPGLHGTSLRYDAKGRPICSVYWPVLGSIQAAPANCQSNFAADPTLYRRATSTIYGTDGSLNARTYLTVDQIPDWANTGGPFTAPRTYLDAAGRLQYSRDSGSNITEVSHDVVGRDTGWTRHAGGTSASTTVQFHSSYDLRGRIIQQRDDSSGTKQFSYLPTGEVTKVTLNATASTPAGDAVIQYRYGSLGRLKAKWTCLPGPSETCTSTTPPPAASQFAYDLPFTSTGGYTFTAGRLASEGNGLVQIAYGYDVAGRMVRRDESFQGVTGWHSAARSYRTDGALLSTVVSSPSLSSPVTYYSRYDSAGRIVKVDDGAATVYWQANAPSASSSAFDALGRLPSSAMDNGLATVSHSYDPVSNLQTAYSSQLGTTPSPTGLFKASGLTYRGTKLAGYTEAVEGSAFSYSYDNDGRLSQAQASATSAAPITPALRQVFSNQFGFAQPGGGSLWNLQSITSSASTSTYNYGPPSNDQVSSVSYPSASADQYQYDLHGMLVSHYVAGQMAPTEQFGYDPEGHLTQMSGSSGVDERLGYDSHGALVQRQLPGSGITSWFVDGDLTIRQTATTSTGSVHVLVGFLRVASVSSSGVLYYHRDRLGSIVATSTNGGVAGVGYRYATYGALTNTSGSETTTNSSELGYTGALKLGHGLLYLNARVYNANLGRFMQADSVDLRRYTYAGGDPINNIDPTGHEDVHWDEKAWQQFIDYGNDRYSGGTGERGVSGSSLLSRPESLWDMKGDFTAAGGFTTDPVFGANFIGSNNPLERNLVNPVSTTAGHWITAVNTGGCPASTETCTIYMDRWVPATPASSLPFGLNSGFGLQYTIAGIADAGMLAGVGFAGSASIGLFTNRARWFNKGVNLGDIFFTGGAFNGPRSDWVIGAYFGFGHGVTVSNAGGPVDMLDEFDNVNFNVGMGIGLSLTGSWGHNAEGKLIVAGTWTTGPGWGLAVSRYTTYTTSVGRWLDLNVP